MELSGVVVLALVSYVTCTPYGYGVKSGAVAKAEANAASGAFGALPAVPLSISSGNGYSGSFSKSSSSSFASSSASSSSSSSSYSFGGSAANGIAGNTIPSTLHGSPSNQNGLGANELGASAAAGASAIGGSSLLHNAGGFPCAGNNCNNDANTNNKCSSNECGLSGHQHSINENKSCLSGQCQPSSGIPNQYGADLQSENSPSVQQQTDLNDFEVNIGGKSKSNNNLSGHSHTSGFDKNGYQNSQNDCSYGKCETNTNEALHKSSIPPHNEKPSTKNCNSPDSGCDIFIPLAPSGSAVLTNPPQPSTHLSTPNIGPACTTHNCNPALTDVNLNNGKPSSYHVPILGVNPSEISSDYNSNKSPTSPLYNLPSGSPINSDITHKIPSYSDGIYSSQLPSSSAGSPGCNGQNCNSLNNPAHHPPSNPSCNSPYCGGHPTDSGLSSQAGFLKPGTAAPSSQSFGASGSNVKPESNSGHYAYPGHINGFLKPNYNNPTAHTDSPNVVAHPGSLEIPKTNTNVLSPSQNTPAYTGGFGAPIGSIDATFGHSGHTASSTLGISDASSHGLTNGLKPGPSVSSSQSSPSYTGGFGGSMGSFETHTGTGSHYQSTNDNPSSSLSIVPHNIGVSTDSGHVPFGLPKPDSGLPSGQINPSYTSDGLVKPTGPADINSGSHDKPQDVGGAPVTGLHGSFGIKPEFGVGSSSQKTHTYTGGFGGSPGSFDTGYKIGSAHDKMLFNPNTATSSSGHTGSDATANSGSGSYHSHNIQKPSKTVIPTNTGYFTGANNAIKPGLVKLVDEKTTLPPYLGGFGGPSGILKPNEYSVSPSLPTHIGSPSCTSGDCGLKLASGESSHASASANAKSGTFSGSFGGPPGLFNPFDSAHSTNGQDAHTGKVITGEHDKSTIKSEYYGNTPLVKDNEHSDVNIAPIDSVNTPSAGANAVASASSLSANQGLSSSGCNSGCGSNYGSGTGGSYASSLGSSKTDFLGGHDSLVGSLASANSAAGAAAKSFGAGRSFASSSASAHASAGAAVKGGYGRR